MENLTTRTLDTGDRTPSQIYAALRARTPGRTSYLIEASEPDARGEQRSWIGFLVKSEAAYSPSSDAVRELATMAVELASAPPNEALPHGGATDVAVLLMRDAILPKHGVAPRAEQPFVGRQLSDIASIAFDHRANTITLSSVNANTVERLALAIASAPPLPDLPPPRGSRPEHATEHPPTAVFSKQLAKAERRLSIGLQRIALSREVVAPTRGADMFEVYRALQIAAPAPYHLFVELAASPMFSAYTLAAAAHDAARLSATVGADAFADELFGSLAVESICGAPEKDAVTAWRDLATFPFGMKGGLFVRARPGGAVDVLRVRSYVSLEEAQLTTVGFADVVPGRSVEAHTEAAFADASEALAAIRHAHDVADARTGAETPSA